ncbi:MAG TPA: glutathione S-transferase family protein, partial [Sphingomicrobium sp.]|nr:glutathione S-transferase family protein [Sphingomicrobium sp.]
MTLQFFGHPFSSYTQKVLIALWSDETPFDYRMVDGDHPENVEELKRHSPFGKFPLLIDGEQAFFESTTIIEHLRACHRGPNDWIPLGEPGRRARFLDRFFDLYVMTNMQKVGLDVLRPQGSRDQYGVDQARAELRRAYDWLDDNLGEGPWAIGETFTLA